MQNCKKFKTAKGALCAWGLENEGASISTVEGAKAFIEWLFKDDGVDYVNSPKQYKLADGRYLQDIFWEVSSYGALYFSLYNASKYEFRKGKKEIAPPEEDMQKADWYIKDVVKRTNHPYSEIRGRVDEILDRAYSVKPIA